MSGSSSGYAPHSALGAIKGLTLSQGQDRDLKFDRSLLSACISFDAMCLSAREMSSNVGRSLGFLDMHALPSLHGPHSTPSGFSLRI